MLELSASEGHRIELEAQPRLGMVGNAAELRRAFSNLAFNAVRYAPKGGDIRMRWFSDENGTHFMVSDTGVRIAEYCGFWCVIALATTELDQGAQLRQFCAPQNREVLGTNETWTA